jgi:peptide/nickel transport system ATP-binding protein
VRLLDVADLRTYIELRSGTIRAVDGVSLSVEAGETLGVVGESGSGKSMTGMSVLRLLPRGGRIVGGRICFEGRDLAELSEQELRKIRGNEIGMIFQDPMTALNPTMTVGDQIAEGVRFHRPVTRTGARARALEVLGLVGMPRPRERLDDYPHQLSGGLRQRVAIAMALACEPKLLIADEPTTALDVAIQAQILDLLDSLKARLGMAMILISHDMGVIAGRANHVVVMYAGKVAEAAPAGALFDNSRHPYTEALLASIPRIDQDRTQALYSIPGAPPDQAAELAGCRFAPRCPRATSECFNTEVELTDEGGHRYACLHPLNVAAMPTRQAERSQAVVREPAVGRGPGQERAPEGAGSGGPLVQIRRVTKEFPVRVGGGIRRARGVLQAVSDVSVEIRAGETFGVAGESGCGKTTLGRMIVGLEEASSGQILVDGVDIAGVRGAQRRALGRDLQLVFQDPYSSLDPRMRVGAIIDEPLRAQAFGGRRERRARVDELLGEVGLGGAAIDRYPHEFSGGQRQRVGIARALALNPRVIVADEPVSALDVSIQSQILNLIRGLQQRHGLTYVVISHDLAVLRYLADRIGVMYLGRLVELGSGDDVYARPAHPYTAGLIGSIPTVPGTASSAPGARPVAGELPSPVDPPSGCRFRTRCPLAQDKCAEVVPEFRRVGSGHMVACHFALEPPAAGSVVLSRAAGG